MTNVRAAEYHANSLHLVDDLTAVVREAGVLVHAAATELGVFIVGEEHPANAEAIEDPHQPRMRGDGIAALDVENHGELARLLACLDIGYGVSQGIVLIVVPDPVPKGGQHFECIGRVNDIEADIEGDDVDAGVAPPFELWKERVITRPQGHTGVALPDNATA